MRIADVALRHRPTVFFLLAALVVAGSSAYLTLPRESSPDITIPMVTVSTLYPGASPEDVETQVTLHIERELQGIDDLEELTSTSYESASVVVVEFTSGIDLDDALQRVRDRVDRAEPDLPEDAEDPQLQEINFSDFPIVQVHISGGVGPVVLKRLAEELQDDVEALPGVLRANLVGGLEREVEVDVDPERLRSYGLALDDVTAAIASENVSIPGGELDLGDRSFAVRVPGEIDDPEAVAEFVVDSRGGRAIFVRDLATVTFGFEDRRSFARIDGRESVALTVQKRAGANIIDVVDAVKVTVAEHAAEWPAGVEPTILGDQSKDIRTMVSDLENNILSGLVLVVIVLMFALGLRNATLVGLSIPFSMLLTFVVIQMSGTTLNMMVLFSLVLAVGMLVDNAVVVIENIYRHMQEGVPRRRAASDATAEVAAAIAVSTFTTLAAFGPLLFWPGVVGDFMVFLPITVSVALVASLVVAFSINPTLASVYLKVDEERRTAGRLRRGADRIGELLIGSYRRTLEWALDHRAIVVAGTVATFVGVVALYGAFQHGIEFFPETQPRQIFVDIEADPGTRLERTDAIARALEDRLGELPDLETMASGVGEGAQADMFGGGGGGDPHKARISLDLADLEDRSQNSFVTMDEVRDRTAGIAGLTVEVDRPDEGPPVGAPLAIEVSGDDFEVLGGVAERIRGLIADIPGLVSLDDDFDLASPEVTVRVDRTEAARLGLSTAAIASTVRTALHGTEASTYRSGEDEYDIVVRVAASARRTLGDLERLTIATDDGALVPLGSVATVTTGGALTAIRHIDRDRVVTITGDVTSPELAEPVRTEAARRIAEADDLLPTGYALAFGGQSEEEAEASAFLTRAFGYAILLVLGLMVAKFDSIGVPLIIVSSVVMSTLGVLIGLLVTGLPFGIIMTGLGVISLAGIVVNNAIVLLDYAEQLRVKGVPQRELVMRTGLRRFRPVVLTAVTTILGLIPLSTGIEFDFRQLRFAVGGESSQWWRGMGVAVIFGLAFATFLTLVIVPVLYDLLLDLRRRMGLDAAAVEGPPPDGPRTEDRTAPGDGTEPGPEEDGEEGPGELVALGGRG